LTPYRSTARRLVAVEVLTIGQLAHDAGVNVETIRFYERRGLLRDPPRTAAGYRQYSGTDLWRLQFIARAKQLGFTLREIGGLMGDDGSSPASAVLRLARAKLESVDQRMQELDVTRSRLEKLVTVCADPTNDDCLALRVPS
jgi:MerR family mercuric resistance operon transcriptional regulator